MSQPPLVSVIIPAYNASLWIGETITSVIEQDYKHYEIIVVNDGSTDNTADIVESFGTAVRCIYKENGGQASARNTGITAATGKYVAFLDADDLWIKDKLKLQVAQLEETGAKWGYADSFAFDGQSKEILYKFSDNQTQHSGDILKALFSTCFIPSPTAIVQRSVFSTVGLFNEESRMRNREDWEMWLRIAAVYPIVSISVPLAYYRVHSASATGSEDHLKSINGHIRVIEEAALREKEILGPLKNAVLSKLFFEEGRWQASIGNTSQSRNMVQKSIALTPGWTLLYFYWLMIPVARWIKIPRKKISIGFIRKIAAKLLKES
jgi:glycosyltransferase involved in cell wall biosynthesis